MTNVGEWGGVSVGALYRELRSMEAEGLVEAVRTEQVGRRLARTVYAITDEGRLELAVLREQAVRSTHWGPEPLGVALTFGSACTDREELGSDIHAGGAVRDRQQPDRGGAEAPAAKAPGPLEAAVMYRAQLHAETEVRCTTNSPRSWPSCRPARGRAPGAGEPGTGLPRPPTTRNREIIDDDH